MLRPRVLFDMHLWFMSVDTDAWLQVHLLQPLICKVQFISLKGMASFT